MAYQTTVASTPTIVLSLYDNMSHNFDNSLSAAYSGKMYGVGYNHGPGTPSYAQINMSNEEIARVGNKLNGKRVVIMSEEDYQFLLSCQET